MIKRTKEFIFKYNNSGNRKGYTLVEVMAILFIIALISSIVLANYRRGEKQYILNSQAQALTQFIREAQNMAMGSAIKEGLIPGAYGVAFEKNNNFLPILYADLNGNKKIDSNEIVKIFNLNKAIIIVSIEGSQCSGDNYYINFFPPDPETFITPNGSDSCDSLLITLDFSPSVSGINPKFIQVSNTGLIEVGELK